ncbi:DUF2079 domain-containing protein [Terriglobus sp. TAA 43]|uniref:DUF2079 domain-containing protein n=1 Tax=Terriglobus sp. TAA 43 TaxID=278961 RepID=UPI0006474138|nr:DUF2079 domain-containing protein [Terriglobus sp. TAA 43]
MSTSTIATDYIQAETNQFPKRPAITLPVALGAASLSIWIWLAFLRPMHTLGALLTAIVFAVAFTLLAYSPSLSLVFRKTTSPALQRELARCAAVFVFLLFFVPEYAARVRPPFVRSAILLAIFIGLWAALFRDSLKEADSQDEETPRNTSWPILEAAVLLAGLTYFAVKKYLVFGYVGQDLAYFGQIMHTTLHGHLFWGSLLQDVLYSHPVTTDFAGHNSPIMFLFLPFYAIFQSPITLLVLRNITMVACAYPVFRIAKLSSTDRAARIWAVAFLLVPVIFYQSVFDFYPLSFVALPVLFTILYYLEGKFRPFTIAFFFTLAVREDLALFAVCLAVVALVQRKSMRWIALPLIAGLVWGVLSYKVVLPHALNGASFVTDACFSHLGATPTEMLTHVCSSPQTTVLTRNNIVYLKQLLTPTGLLLPFGSSLVIASFPFLAINLLAGAGKCITTVIYAQYSVVPATVLFIAALLFSTNSKSKLASLSRLRLSSSRVAPLITLALTVATLAFATGKAQFDEISKQPWDAEAHKVAAMIPSDASLAAPRYMLPAVANRDCLYQTHRLYQYHHPVYEYLVLDKDWAHINAAAEYETAYRQLLATAPVDPRFQVIYESPNYLVLRDPAMHGVGCFPNANGGQQ